MRSTGMLLRVLRSFALIYATVAAFAWIASDRLIFPRPPTTYRDDASIVKLTTDDGVTISAVHLPNDAARFTIVHSHGNGEDLGDLQPSLEALRDAGFAVVAYDYRGYGTSEGSPSSKGTLRDVRAAYRYVVDSLKVPPERIILHGRSVGAAMAIDLAAHERVGGLVIESPFVSAFRVKTRIPILPFDKFNNLALMPRVSCPLLVMHGTKDTLIPPWHGQALYDAAREPKTLMLVDGAGHNDLEGVAGMEYLDAFVTFAASL